MDTNTLYQNTQVLFTKQANQTKARGLLCASFILLGWLLFIIGIAIFDGSVLSNTLNTATNSAYAALVDTASTATRPAYEPESTYNFFTSGVIAGLVIYVIGILMFIASYIALLIISVVMYTSPDYKVYNNTTEGVRIALIVSNVLAFLIPLGGSIFFMVMIVVANNTNSSYFNKQIQDYVDKQIAKQQPIQAINTITSNQTNINTTSDVNNTTTQTTPNPTTSNS